MIFKNFLLVFLFFFSKALAQQPEKITLSPDLELIKISEHAYMHVSYVNSPSYGRMGANGLVFISGKEAFLFDSPWTDSLTKELYKWLTDSMKLTLKGFIPNHWHEDCMGGLGFLNHIPIRSFAFEKTVEIAKSKGLPVPVTSFKDSLQLAVGDKTIWCYYLGAAHATDNIIVWIPSEKILFPGCMVKSMNANNLGNTADGDVISYPLTLQNLIKKFPDPAIVIPGHGPFGGKELILHTVRLSEAAIKP